MSIKTVRDIIDYDRVPAINFSTLKHMERGPLYYKAALETRTKPTAAMALGTAVHCLVLELEQFEARYCVADIDRRTKAGKEQAALEAEAGREILKLSEFAEIKAMADSVMANPEAAKLLTHCTTEAALTWSMDGFNCKGRIDAYRLEPVPVLIDFKTAAEMDPRLFRMQSWKMHYHVQLAWYAAGMVHALGCQYPEVSMIVVGSKPPHECIVYHLPVHVLDAGEQKYLRWLDELKQCRESGGFPSSYEGINELELPAWAVSEAETETSLIIGGEEYVL